MRARLIALVILTAKLPVAVSCLAGIPSWPNSNSEAVVRYPGRQLPDGASSNANPQEEPRPSDSCHLTIARLHGTFRLGR